MLLGFDCELELEVFLLLVCFGCGVPLLTLEAVPQAPKRRPSGKIAPTNHRDVFIAAPFLGTPIGHYDNRNYTLRQPQLHTVTTPLWNCSPNTSTAIGPNISIVFTRASSDASVFCRDLPFSTLSSLVGNPGIWRFSCAVATSSARISPASPSLTMTVPVRSTVTQIGWSSVTLAYRPSPRPLVVDVDGSAVVGLAF